MRSSSSALASANETSAFVSFALIFAIPCCVKIVDSISTDWFDSPLNLFWTQAGRNFYPIVLQGYSLFLVMP